MLLKNLEDGSRFKMNNSEGIKLDSGSGSVSVLIYEVGIMDGMKNDPFYLGKQFWSNRTPVTKLKDKL